MPCFCAAVGCSNRRNAKTKEQRITFHRFPKDKVKRRAWTAALRRRDFKPNDRSVICSCHFKSDDFDMTGQTTRLREGVIPSVFGFSDRHCKVPTKPRTTRTSLKAVTQIPEVPVKLSVKREESTSNHQYALEQDHQYALDPVQVKKKLSEAQKRIEELQRDLRNAKDRERRLKKTVKSLVKELKHKNMLTKELQEELDLYSDLPV
ncbi:THAP domain-containing protein 2-like isoform X3 [Acanthopagrus latus]|uniref:THAP domain-containing protein 2-like isoform X3 n=1 Tax=Acanthopagrus latus TaxID=8177 RepID=UPI00187D031B|nr:THAP domain-containing protein 2-like isoform X3 [Acanthopagrus latus]